MSCVDLYQMHGSNCDFFREYQAAVGDTDSSFSKHRPNRACWWQAGAPVEKTQVDILEYMIWYDRIWTERFATRTFVSVRNMSGSTYWHLWLTRETISPGVVHQEYLGPSCGSRTFWKCGSPGKTLSPRGSYLYQRRYGPFIFIYMGIPYHTSY